MNLSSILIRLWCLQEQLELALGKNTWTRHTNTYFYDGFSWGKVKSVHSIKSAERYTSYHCAYGVHVKQNIEMICHWNGKTDIVGTLGIKHWDYSACFLNDTTHRFLRLSNNPCLAPGKVPSKIIFVYIKAGHNNNNMFLGNIQRSGFATDLETLCLEIILFP